MEVINVNPGNLVICDYCNTDYTERKDVGGIYFAGYAICPECAPRTMHTIKKYNEERFILDKAKENESFRDFVYRIRNTVYK